MELGQAKDQGVAIIIKRGGVITGFAAGIGILGLAVAKSNKDLNALIGIASAIVGPGFFARGRNHDCLKVDFILVGLQIL